MKILHIYTGGGEIYGAERVIYNLAAEQIKRRMNAEVVYFERPGPNSFLKLLRNKDIPVHVVHSRSKLDIGAFMGLRRIFLRSSPKILHSHGYKGDIFLALLKRTLGGTPILSTKHGSTDSSSRIRVYDYLGDVSLKYFDRVIAVSDFTKSKLIERHIPEKKVEVIHNGVDVSSFDRSGEGRLRRMLNLSPGSRLVGFIGRLGPEKGIRYLLEAARILCGKMGGVYFVLVGDGELKEETEAFIVSHNLKERIFMLGWRKDATELLADMDILLLPSLTEGTPMVILESMAMGVPVIASGVGGIGEVIEDQKTGLLIEPGDSGAIVRSTTALLDNPRLSEAISHNSIALVRSRFSAEHMAELYNKTYNSLLEGGN